MPGEWCIVAAEDNDQDQDEEVEAGRGSNPEKSYSNLIDETLFCRFWLIQSFLRQENST